MTHIQRYIDIFYGDIHFTDPFHDIVGIDALWELFQKIFDSFEKYQFRIIEVVKDDSICYLKWRFTYILKGKKLERSFIGVSRVVFNTDGKAIIHEDFWDGGEVVYENIPFLVFIIKFIKKLMLR